MGVKAVVSEFLAWMYILYVYINICMLLDES